MRKRNLLVFLLGILISVAVDAQYQVISITGKVTVETDGGRRRDVRLRETLTPQSKLNLTYNSQLELFNEEQSKKYILHVPGAGQLGSMLNDRQNSVVQLTGQFLAYIKARLKGNGELTSRRFSDAATVTREIAEAPMTARERYEAYRSKARDRYDTYRRNALNRYTTYMRSAWERYSAQPPIPQPKDEDVPPVVAKEEVPVIAKEDKSLQTSGVAIMPKPEPEPQPQPAEPIREKKDKEIEYAQFQFYGTPLRVRFSGREKFVLKGTTTDDVADAYERLASDDFNNTILDCLQLCDHLQLGDWAYMQMLDSLATACFSTYNEATLMQGFIYQQSGYKLRFAVQADSLHLLYATDHIIYGRGYYNNLDPDYYFYVYGPDVDPLRICFGDYPEEKHLSLLMSKPMLVAENYGEERTVTSYRYPDMTFTFRVNRNLLNFYNSYPTSMLGEDFMTRWAMYANMPMDESVRQSLEADMHLKLDSLTELQAVERMLNWVQTGFEYEYDNEVWGGDRAFFAEETLHYPFCDCEDRSILLSRLVRDILGLKVMLLYYPGHMAMAVHFNDEGVSGDYIEHDGLRYFVCDPTITGVGAPVGTTMPGMEDQPIYSILLQ